MFNPYAALLINTPPGAPLTERLLPYFRQFCDPASPDFWPELLPELRDQHPAWFELLGQGGAPARSRPGSVG